MKRVFLACVAVVFLFGISTASFAGGKGGEMKGKAESTKEEGMKKGQGTRGDMKGEGAGISAEAQDKASPDKKIEAKGKEKSGKSKKKAKKQ
jgi:hypothetical protein